ncbi:TIGR04211 family SH3 domain-containing protein [Fontimonas sp. SYSU GA230001]|uniref:TIGR04211 family SH3 domain-containing protein n=1 Tax=Fontimonas sp. SYSU GA230001 TaxID=3142450 RepID=UPI0032B597A0
MTRTLFALLALSSLSLTAFAQSVAQAPGSPRYISDQITVTLRERPTNDAAPLGSVKSGARVVLLESLGPDSFSRIRSADGREGWIPSRFVSGEPAARDQLDQLRGEREQINAQVRTLEQQLRAAQEQLAKARPAFELSQDNERLRAAMAALERETEAAQQRFDADRAQRRSLLTGGGLIVGGIFLGLVLPYMGRGKKRRYGDF